MIHTNINALPNIVTEPIFTKGVVNNKLKWRTDTDWNLGTFDDSEVNGVGDAALLQSESLGNETNNIPFTTAGNYTLSSGTDLEITGGVLRLKASGGTSTSFPFTTDTNYTFNSSDIEVTGGVAKIIRGLTNPNSIDLDGTDEYIEVPDDASLTNSPKFSVAFWCKPDVDATMYAISKFGVAGQREFGVRMNSGTRTISIIYSATGTATDTTVGTTALSLNTWHHVVCAFDGDAGTMDIYLDGTADKNDTTALTGIANKDENLLIGALGPDTSPQNFWNGKLNQVAIYNDALSSGEVTDIYNSGTPPNLLTLSSSSALVSWWTFNDPDDDATASTGNINDVVGTNDGTPTNTESGDLIVDSPGGVTNPSDPPIVNATGVVFATALTAFNETTTLPENTAIQYHVSSDNGSTWEYWDGGAWAVTDDTFAQSNPATTIDANIFTLAGSGTFKFRALLRSTSVNTPELDEVVVAGETYSTTDDLYGETKDAVQISPSQLESWFSLTNTVTQPASTDIRLLFSNDGRTSWLTWNGSAWAAPTSDTTRTDATSLSDAVTNFSVLPTGDDTLDVRVFLKTDVSTSRPSVDNLQVISSSGFRTSWEYETNQFDSGIINNVWGIYSQSVLTPVGTTISISVRAANTLTDLSAAAYSASLTDGLDPGISGQFIQFKVVGTGTTAVTSAADQIDILYQTNAVSEVNP